MHITINCLGLGFISCYNFRFMMSHFLLRHPRISMATIWRCLIASSCNELPIYTKLRLGRTCGPQPMTFWWCLELFVVWISSHSHAAFYEGNRIKIFIVWHTFLQIYVPKQKEQSYIQISIHKSLKLINKSFWAFDEIDIIYLGVMKANKLSLTIYISYNTCKVTGTKT